MPGKFKPPLLGEGFDHPKLSVAAIFRPFRTLAPYIQFVGRILRVMVQNNPGHPDNYGHVVTHAGMNLDKRLQEFKLFENDDQKFWESVVRVDDPEPPNEVKTGSTRMRLSETAVANYEIVDSLIEEDFTTAEDEDIIRELETKLETLGLDPASAREIVMSKKPLRTTSPAAQPYQVLPQRQWEQLRKGLAEQVNRTANIFINRLELDRTGRELINRGISASNNFVGGVTLINSALKERNPKSRKDWTTEEFKQAHESLDDILNKLTQRWKGILSEKC